MSKGTDGFWDAVVSGIDAVMTEAIMPALEKTIPQGAAELSQALFAESAYVPYGPTDREMEMPDQSLGQAMENLPLEPPQVEPPQHEMGGHEM